MPTLWRLTYSPPACAVIVLGDILGVKFDYIDFNFMNLEHKSPEFLKLNPVGSLPLLKDGDFLLTDSHAMLTYVLGKYGTPAQRESLYPSDLEARALVDQALYFDTGVFFIRFKEVAMPTKLEGLTGPTPKNIENIDAAYAVVEAYLGNKKYIAADHLTLADLSVGTTALSIQTIHKLDRKRFPRTAAWLDRMDKLPVFKKVTEPAFKLLDQSFQEAWEKNKQNQKHN